MGASRIAGRYELQDQLGEGGMGVVWRALDVKTGSAVAIKLMKDISDPVAVELFTKEWKALAEISHPNIVEVRDVDVIEENRQKKPFFVMPLLRGATLAELIANASVRLTLERIVEITTHVCRGLQAAHQRGLVHRDLKPSNIFVMDDDTAKIIDFGVVHLAGSKSVTGQKGTFQYMSPEQAQLKEITPASDIFSLGVILYEALTRRKPFARKTAEETMEAVIKLMPPPVSELYPSINQQVSKVVHKCLAKQPIHRFASARELAETLQKAARNEPVFDSSKIEPRIERARAAFKSGDEVFASEILAELESEGNLDPRITVLRMQIDVTVKQKKIRQLLESARARMEQDEIPLALDKIREVLELDPQNPDALAMRKAMEKQRSEAQIAKWLELAQTHLGNRDFGAARNAAQEVLAIRSADTRALDLLDKIESTEADAKRIRDQKEQLYSSAMRAYQNGEIDSALSKLERLFSVARANPNAAIPERDAVYQSFYKEVRSEREAIRSAFEDAQRQFSEKNFAGALTVCQELLSKYPNDGTIQALKIRIEDAERQELSSYIAEVSKRLEGEPDLDRRVNILREASERYANETHFAQQLKVTRERRDLVNAIVTKARQYEERGQYAEAISQWDILRNIHPQYSGIAFEQEQCKKKRDRQAKEEEHSRLVEEIDGLMERRAYAKAMECAEAALRDFPNDAELAGLRTLAEQGMERSKESRRLFEEGQQALADQDLARATELLRSSLNLDPRAPGLREAVVTVLTERARALVEQENWRDAEPLYQEANDLDGTHAAVRALRSSITEGKRQVFVGQCLTECRALVAAGKAQEAGERIRAARAQYPNDSRLEQYESSLQKEVNEARRAEERVRDRAALGENRRLAEQNAGGVDWRDLLERSYAIKARHLDEPEFVETIADIELSVKRAAKVDDLSQLLSLESVRSGTDGRPVVVSKPGSLQASPVADRKGPKLVDSGERTKVFEVPEPQPKADHLKDVLRQAQAGLDKAATFAKEIARKSLALVRPAKELSSVTLLIIATAVVLLAASAYVIFRKSAAVTVVEPPLPRLISITTDPADSTITSDGKPITNGSAAIGTTIEVSHLGYKTSPVRLQQDVDGRVKLTPEPVRLSIHTSEPAGSVAVDDQTIGELAEGALDEYELPADGKTHRISVTSRGKTLFTVEVEVPAGSQPRVNSLDAPDLFAVSSLGTQATWYAGSQLANARFGEQSVAVNPSGVSLTLSDQDHELHYGNGSDQGSFAVEILNGPALALRSLNAEGQVLITSNVEHGVLTVDGVPVSAGKNGWTVRRPPGSYKFVLSADGYQTRTVTVPMQRRRAFIKKIELDAIVGEPLKAGLEITGGTPGANVAVDGTRVGELDPSGNLKVEDVLTVGKHTVVFSKSGYETFSESVSVSTPAAGRAPTDAIIAKRVLSASAVAVTFESNAKDVAIKYRRVGETQFQATSAGEKLALAPGRYEISAEAGGYMPYSTTTDVGKETSVIPLNLVPSPGYEFQDLSQVEQSEGWFKTKSPGKPVYLKPGLLNVTLVFFRAGKSWAGLKDKKVEWLIEDPTHHARIQYTLENQSGKFTRKLISGDDISDEFDKKVDAVAVNQQTSLSVHVQTEAGHVRISNDKGVTLDDFTAPAQDFSRGKIGIRSDSLFLVRRDNP
jgi:serine/threonine protein kinase